MKQRRQNKLIGSRATVLNVWYESLASEHLFGQFTTEPLRARLMPAIKNFG